MDANSEIELGLELYPVFVRMTRTLDHIFIFDTYTYLQSSSSQERCISFCAPTWDIKKEKYIGTGKNEFYIFVSKKTYDELARPRQFMPHYLLKKKSFEWRSAQDLSPETRRELLLMAMRLSYIL